MATRKAKKLPPRPKANAPLKTWEAYETKVKKIQQENKQLVDDLKKRERIIENINKMISNSGLQVRPRKGTTRNKKSGWF